MSAGSSDRGGEQRLAPHQLAIVAAGGRYEVVVMSSWMEIAWAREVQHIELQR